MDAVTINRMLDHRINELARQGGFVPPEDANQILLKSLGLFPLPERTDLKLRITGVIQRDRYRIEKLRYESVPGLLVTAHLYVPEGKGPFPIILSPHGHFGHKKVEPLVQARGISLALEGFATLIVDSPGVSWDRNPQNERLGIGDHDNWFLSMGRCIQGVYAWDLVRGLDYLATRKDMDASRVGITGASGGGTATMYTFAIDQRIKCAVPVCFATSFEVQPRNGCLCNHVPGVLALGDRADVLAIRAPAPILLIGAQDDDEFPPEGHVKTWDKLRSIYKANRAESKVRLELFEGGHDYNRRMREAMVAFFREHLLGEPAQRSVPEKRPMTDGCCNPYEAGTADRRDPRLMVTPWFDRETKTFDDLLHDAFVEEKRSPFLASDRLVGWGRYGKVEKLKGTEVVKFHDQGEASPHKDSIRLPYKEIELRQCVYLGISIPELFAQILHFQLPGGMEGWESSGMAHTSDALTTMIASVRTLVLSSHPEIPPEKVVATGPVASFTAMFLHLYRPNLVVEASHDFQGWQDAISMNLPALIQPNARYLEWPFRSVADGC